MRSQIKTIDALLAEEKSYPINVQPKEPIGIEMTILGFRNVQYKEKLHRPISKIMDPLMIINEE